MTSSAPMKWLRRAVVAVVVLLVLAVVAVVSATVGWTVFLFGPRQRRITDVRYEASPARLERGRYLVESRYGCFGCHTERDWSRPGAPAVAGQEGRGHNWAGEGMPWLTAPNITPDAETGLGDWKDDAIGRAIREGVSRDGRALFPIMPYPMYRRISDEDLASIVVYLRSRKPIRHELRATDVPFPVSFFITALPQPLDGPVAEPDLSTPVKRGEFLVRTVDCAGCHTAKERGQDLPGLDLGGGFELLTPLGKVVSTNLTPDPSGIPYYDEALFIQAMRTGKVGAREIHPLMPWKYMGTWTDEDLKATFAYLQTLPKVAHQVSNQEPPTDCPVCRGKHGLGDRNPAPR
jgi:mono/diheme cytochrome c family protein